MSARLLFLCLCLIQISISAPVVVVQGFNAYSAFEASTDATWNLFWNSGQHSLSLNDASCPGSTFAYPLVWDVAVAGTAFTNSGNTERLNDVAQNLLQYRRGDGWFSASTAKDDDIYVDDNAQILWVFVDAYKATNNGDYLSIAQRTMDLIRSQWNLNIGGIQWNKDGDYIASISTSEAALAAVKLYEVAPDSNLLDFAQHCLNWLYTNLQDPNDHLFFDGISLPSGDVNQGKLTYTVGSVLSTLAYLNKFTGESSFLDTAVTLGNAAAGGSGAFYGSNGYWNNQMKYSHLLFAGIADILKLPSSATAQQGGAFVSFAQEAIRNAAYIYYFLQDGNTGGYVDSPFSYSEAIFNKYFNVFKAGTYAPDAENFCNNDIGAGQVKKVLIDNASVSQIFFEVSRMIAQ